MENFSTSAVDEHIKPGKYIAIWAEHSAKSVSVHISNGIEKKSPARGTFADITLAAGFSRFRDALRHYFVSDFYGSEIVVLSSVHISLVFGENLFEVSVILLENKKKVL